MAKSDEERVREAYEKGGAKGASEAIRDIEREREDRDRDRVPSVTKREGETVAEAKERLKEKIRERESREREISEREPLVPIEKIEALKLPPLGERPSYLESRRAAAEAARQKTFERRKEALITKAHRERSEEARRVAAKKGITITEALAELGAPIPEYAVQQAKEARESAEARQEVAKKYKELTPEAQFRALVSLGDIEKGSIFVPQLGKEWGYLTPSVISNIKRDTPELHSILIKDGYRAYTRTITKEIETVEAHNKKAKEINDAVVLLKEKNLLDKNDNFYLGKAIEAKIPFNTLALVGITRAEYDETRNTIAKEKWAVKTLEDYKAPKDKGYYITKALDSNKAEVIAAVYALYDTKTIQKIAQPVKLSKEATARARVEFQKESKPEQALVISSVLGKYIPEKAALVGYKSFDKLSDKEQQQVVDHYALLKSEVKTKWGTVSAPKWMDLSKEGIETAIAFTPVVGTVYYWEDMTPGQKALSIAGDALFFTAPFIIPKAASAISSIRMVGKSKAAKVVDKLTRAASQDTISILRKVNKPAALQLQRVTKAQSSYAQSLVKIRDIQTALRAKRVIGRSVLESNLAKAIKTAEESKLALSNQAQAYVNIIKKTMPAYLDDPAVLETFTRMAKDLPQWTDDMVRTATVSQKANVLETKTALLKAQNILFKAKDRFPTDPSKWTDLVQDVTELEVKLMAAQTGDIAILQRQLITARKIIPVLKSEIKYARATDSPYLATLERKLAKAEDLAQTLPGKIDKAVKTMEVEWGRGGSMGSGRVATAVKAPKGITPVGVATAKPDTATMTIAQLARVLGLGLQESAYFADFARIIKVNPKDIAKYKIEPAVVPSPVPLAALKPSTIPLPILLTTPAPVPSPVPAPAPAPAPSPEPSPVPKPVPKPIPEPILKPVPTPTPKPTISLIPVILTDKEKEEEKARARIVPAPITWRQGIRWITIYPPFKSEADVKITRKPPAGAKVATGAGSAYKTIQSLGGKPTLVQVGIDMGMQDVFVRRKAGKASIRFRKDLHQRTRQDISLAGVRR